MRTSDRGVVALMLHEGIVPGPYRDSVGVWTFGIGHTAAAGPPIPEEMPRGMPADLDRAIERAFAVFRQDLTAYEAEVRRVLPNVRQHEFDAAVSFHYNTGAIGRATWVKRLRAGDAPGAARAIMNWVKPPEIRKRREAERDLLLHGRYPAGAIPVYGVTSNGSVQWRPVRTLSTEAALALWRGRPEPPPPQAVLIGDPVEPPSGGFLHAIAAVLRRLFGA